MRDFLALQNGSDIRGVALPGVPGEEVSLSTDAARMIGTAFVLWLAKKRGKACGELKIGVGRDSRISGPNLQRAVISGLSAGGAAAVDCAMASTPGMFMSTVLPELRFDGAVMITASHLPWNRNGLKFFTDGGGLETDEVRELLETARRGIRGNGRTGRIRAADVMSPYIRHLKRLVTEGIGDGERPLTGLRIAVDAGNGAGGFFATKVLLPLGADISSSVCLEPDGNFPNHAPNPENAEAMASFCRTVRENRCDLGFLFDTDVDRVGAVLSDGTAVSRNRLIALMSAIVAETAPGSTVVTDSVTSDGLTEFITGLGLRHHRFRRGYKNVINEARRLNASGRRCLLAIETSGHAALRENRFLDDGAYLAVRILIRYAKLRREGRELTDLLRGFTEPAEAEELRIPIRDADFQAAGERVLEGLKAYASGRRGWKKTGRNYEGIRISLPDSEGWFLLRLSLHDPVMPLNIESGRPGGAAEILEALMPFLRTRPELDLSFLSGSRAEG